MMGPVLVRVIAVATFNLNSAAMPIHPVIEARLSRLTHLSRKCVSGRGREGKGAGAARQRSLLHLRLCPNPCPLPLAQQDWRDETECAKDWHQTNERMCVIDQKHHHKHHHKHHENWSKARHASKARQASNVLLIREGAKRQSQTSSAQDWREKGAQHLYVAYTRVSKCLTFRR